MLEAGIKGRQEVVVSDANSAKTMGSGTLDVFATPAMTALMEKTAWMRKTSGLRGFEYLIRELSV